MKKSHIQKIINEEFVNILREQTIRNIPEATETVQSEAASGKGYNVVYRDNAFDKTYTAQFPVGTSKAEIKRMLKQVVRVGLEIVSIMPIKEVKESNLSESLNPQVISAVKRLVKTMARKYGYEDQDAVYAIVQALKKMGFSGLGESVTETEEPLEESRNHDLVKLENEIFGLTYKIKKLLQREAGITVAKAFSKIEDGFFKTLKKLTDKNKL
jgi:hypothetical protein